MQDHIKGKDLEFKKDNNKFKQPGQKNKKLDPNKRKGKFHNMTLC